MYYAHSSGMPERYNWQLLREHLLAVSALAGMSAERFGLQRAATLAGLLHDLGKYTAEFQARLAGSLDRVDHSTAGAHVVLAFPTTGYDRLMAELIASAIAGHHAGLPDRLGLAGSLQARLDGYDGAGLDPVWRDEIVPEASGLFPAIDAMAGLEGMTREQAKRIIAFRIAFLGRMLFSCLVDADFKDTEAYFARIGQYTVDRDWPALGDALPALVARFDAHMARFADREGPVNQLRREILASVRGHAGDTPGLFTLTVPTGGGKTLASLGFALDHARTHGLRRIIYAIPFTSIIDQTATIFRDVLGDDVVLEHHSAIDQDKLPRDDEPNQARAKLKLAMEDWAAPVVVTTTVQLFESLFAARSSRCRKLHNIAGSVIVLDEAQTLPHKLLVPSVRAIDELARNYGCSIVLCTATQPALNASRLTEGHLLGLPLEGRELAPDPPRFARELKRTRIRFAGAMDDGAFVEALGETRQGLVIVNSRGHALALYRAAKEAGLEGLFHLTTRQYAAHRREILADVRRRLAAKEPCRVIATSLIEAGVDVDFPAVWRAEAGLDQIAQAAGRCNREGKADAAASLVTIFSAPNNPPPAEIRGLVGDLARMAGKHDDLLSPAAIEDYFGEVYWRKGADLDGKKILEKFTITGTAPNFSYRTVAEAFRMIESGLAPVIVVRDEAAKTAVRKLSLDDVPTGALARALQPYTVQVPPKARQLLIGNGHVRHVAPELRGDQFAVLTADSLYTDEVGLLWENAEYLTLESSIF